MGGHEEGRVRWRGREGGWVSPNGWNGDREMR